MCEPISIGIAIGAATGAVSSAITGGDILQGALIGGITGGFTGGMGGLDVGSLSGQLGGKIIQTSAPAIFGGVSSSAIVGFAAASLVGGTVLGALTPKAPDYGYTPAAQQVQYNSQNIATTGSGGRQATASLADAIKRSKKRKLTQEDVGDLSIDTGSFANIGLQLA
tara:strand:+ start:130 stop:630 length:501 start_codon:yes stop_codon:yes gene_type:complete